MAKKKNPVSVRKNGKTLYGAAAMKVLEARDRRAKARTGRGTASAKKTTAKKPARKRNAASFSSSTPISVSQHFRSGGKNYATAREKIIRQGQRDLFAPEASMDQLLGYLKKNPTVLDAVRRKFGDPLKLSNSKLKAAMRLVVQGARAKTKKRNPAPRRRNSAVNEIFEEFHGRPSDNITLVEAQPYLPDDLTFLGYLDGVLYTTIKTHLGDTKPQGYVHEFGENGGEIPMLCCDRNKKLVIVGGDYTIDEAGIIN